MICYTRAVTPYGIPREPLNSRILLAKTLNQGTSGVLDPSRSRGLHHSMQLPASTPRRRKNLRFRPQVYGSFLPSYLARTKPALQGNSEVTVESNFILWKSVSVGDFGSISTLIKIHTQPSCWFKHEFPGLITSLCFYTQTVRIFWKWFMGLVAGIGPRPRASFSRPTWQGPGPHCRLGLLGLRVQIEFMV